MQIFISRDGEQAGPYSVEDINACLKDGTLLPSDLACQEGMEEWVPLSEMEFSELNVPRGESKSDLELSEDLTELSDSSDVNERIAATGFKQHIFLNKSIGVAILFAILTFWLSESAFRPPPVDDEPSWEWFGWAVVVKGDYQPRENGGPIYKFMAGIADEVGLGGTGFFTWSRYLRDRGAVTMWMLFCLIFGIGFFIMRARSWKKKFHQDEAYDEPIISLSLLKKIKYALLILGFLILCFETRNGLNRSQRTKNIQFQLAVVKGNIEDVKNFLTAGADVNVRRWGRSTDRKLLSEEDEALLKGNIIGGGIKKGYTALHCAARNGQTEILKLLLSNGADVNAKNRKHYSSSYEDGKITPLDLANSGGHTEIIELLKKHDGKPGEELGGTE